MSLKDFLDKALSKKDAFPEGALISRDKLVSAKGFNDNINAILNLIGQNKIEQAKDKLAELTEQDVEKAKDVAGAWICIRFVTSKTVGEEARGIPKDVTLLKPDEAKGTKFTKRTNKLKLDEAVANKLETDLPVIDLNKINDSIEPLIANKFQTGFYSIKRSVKAKIRDKAAANEYKKYLENLKLEDFDKTNPRTNRKTFDIDAFKKHFEEQITSNRLIGVAITMKEKKTVSEVIDYLDDLRDWIKDVNLSDLAKKLKDHIETINQI